MLAVLDPDVSNERTAFTFGDWVDPIFPRNSESLHMKAILFAETSESVNAATQHQIPEHQNAFRPVLWKPHVATFNTVVRNVRDYYPILNVRNYYPILNVRNYCPILRNVRNCSAKDTKYCLQDHRFGNLRCQQLALWSDDQGKANGPISGHYIVWQPSVVAFCRLVYHITVGSDKR